MSGDQPAHIPSPIAVATALVSGAKSERANFGILERYVMLKTGNCMYSAILHGAMDIIGEAGVWISLSSKSPLLGSNPTGMISISVTVLVAAFLFVRINEKSQYWIYSETNSKVSAVF